MQTPTIIICIETVIVLHRFTNSNHDQGPNITEACSILGKMIDSHFVQRPFRTKTTSYKGDQFVQKHRSHFEQGFFGRGGTWIFTYTRKGVISYKDIVYDLIYRTTSMLFLSIIQSIEK